MTRRVALFSVVALIIGGAPAHAALPPHIDVRAHQIGLYNGATPVVDAQGGVVVRVGGRIVRADQMRYDLSENRLVASGNVDVSSSTGDVHAAAYALDVPTGDAAALHLDTTPPQTVIIPGDASPAVVAPPASGTFDLADLSAQKAFVRGPHAVIVPNATVRFAPARVLTDVGNTVPSPSYLFSFEANPSFAQQSLPGATFDQPYGLFGSPSALTALHFRYDQGAGGIGVGLDTHLVNGTKSYAVASVLPLGNAARLDLVGFEQLTPVMTQQLLASRQYGITTAQYTLLHNEAVSVTSLTLGQFGGLETADLRISSLSRPIAHLFSYKLSADAGYDHQNGMLPLPSDGRATLEGLFTSPALRAPLGVSLSSSLDLSETRYNFPRERGQSIFTTFLSKQVAPAVRFIGQVQVVQIYDRYRNDQSFFYPPLTPTLPDGTIYYGYAAYNGASTLRTYSLTGTYAPNADFNLQLSLTHHRDFPQFDGYGNPPYSVGFDIRVRPRGGPAIEIGRSYIFNWGDQRFSPGYTLSIAP